MIFQNKLAKTPKLTERLLTNGWNSIGAIKRETDNRTKSQLLENIDYFAIKFPEVAKFRNELKTMDKKFLGLTSDICELASEHKLLPNEIFQNIDIRANAKNEKSLFEFLMENLPKTAKENPEALELTQAIIDNTDSTASKFALYKLAPMFECKDAANHMKATIPFVHNIAESTLKGMYLKGTSTLQNFVNGLSNFISPSVSLEKLQFLPKIIEIAEKSKANCIRDAFPFLRNNTPMDTIKENLNTFEQIEKNMENKTINITDFLEKNVNLI